jgi:AhpD family alkylhydroperoxidase
MSGSSLLRTRAPAVADALDAVVATLWSVAARRGMTGLVAEAAVRSATLLDVDPLVPPAPGPSDEAAPPAAIDGAAVLAFAEQCTLDVSAVTDGQRAAFLDAAGRGAGDLAAALWVVDVVPRTRAALDALDCAGPWPEPGPTATGDDDLWASLDGLIRIVPALDALDPVTSEVIRLRGARAHRCRLCMSVRSRPALRAGADESTFDAVDHPGDGTLTPLARAALALVDGMVWTPGRLDPGVVAGLAAVATPAQQVEVVLDVTRNALNKIAVALGADAAHVEDGVEVYDVEPDGTLVYGVPVD